MSIITQLKETKKKIERLQLDEQRQLGIKEQLRKDLKEKFDVTTIPEAEELLTELQADVVKEETSLTDILTKLQKVINDNSN